MIGRQEAGIEATSTVAPPVDEAVTVGSDILRVALTYDRLLARGLGRDGALACLAQRPADYPPHVVAALATLKTDEEERPTVRVFVPGLRVGMVVAEDVRVANGCAVLPAGTRISEPVEARLRSYARIVGLQEPVLVYAA